MEMSEHQTTSQPQPLETDGCLTSDGNDQTASGPTREESSFKYSYVTVVRNPIQPVQATNTQITDDDPAYI